MKSKMEPVFYPDKKVKHPEYTVLCPVTNAQAISFLEKSPKQRTFRRLKWLNHSEWNQLPLSEAFGKSRNELRYAKSNKESIFTAAQIKIELTTDSPAIRKNQFALFFAARSFFAFSMSYIVGLSVLVPALSSRKSNK